MEKKERQQQIANMTLVLVLGAVRCVLLTVWLSSQWGQISHINPLLPHSMCITEQYKGPHSNGAQTYRHLFWATLSAEEHFAWGSGFFKAVKEQRVKPEQFPNEAWWTATPILLSHIPPHSLTHFLPVSLYSLFPVAEYIWAKLSAAAAYWSSRSFSALLLLRGDCSFTAV